VKCVPFCATLALLAGHVWADNVAPVAVYTSFENEPSPFVLDSIRSEVNSLMAPLKIPFEWRTLSKSAVEGAAVQLAVVTFKGSCTSNDNAFFRSVTSPLGWTHITDGVVLPFADVDCSRVHALMDRSLHTVAPGRREAVFARAVGRVVTHELYHIFTGTRHHGTDDVAHPVYTAQDLVSDQFQFGNKELSTLRKGFTPVLRALRLSHGIPLQSAQLGRTLYELGACARCHGSQAEGTSLAPALRPPGNRVDSKYFNAKLSKEIGHMYRDRKLAPPPPLNDDDIDDIVSYLNSLEFVPEEHR
jgi:cytochrome c553